MAPLSTRASHLPRLAARSPISRRPRSAKEASAAGTGSVRSGRCAAPPARGPWPDPGPEPAPRARLQRCEPMALAPFIQRMAQGRGQALQAHWLQAESSQRGSLRRGGLWGRLGSGSASDPSAAGAAGGRVTTRNDAVSQSSARVRAPESSRSRHAPGKRETGRRGRGPARRGRAGPLRQRPGGVGMCCGQVA